MVSVHLSVALSLLLQATLSLSFVDCFCCFSSSQCIFPDAYDLPEDEMSSEGGEKVKSAPRNSISRKLAGTLCIVNNDNGDLQGQRGREVGGDGMKWVGMGGRWVGTG